MHNPVQLEEPNRIVRFDMDQAAGVQSREAFVEDMANSDVLVIGSHFSEPSAGYVVSDADGCRLDTDQESK